MNEEVIIPEELPIEQAVEKSFVTELEKLEITKKFLEEQRDNCLTLKLNGQDKEAYTIIRETRLNMKTRRVAIEKICKKGREDATRTQKAWIAVEKDWKKIVSEGEDYLSKLEEEYETEAERIKQEAKRKMEEAFILRQSELTKMGAQYQEGFFVLNDVSYEAVLVKECDEDLWEGTIKKAFHAQFLTNESNRLLEERRKMEEAQAIQRQKEEQERRERELQEREAAIKKAEEERLQKEQEEQRRKEAEEKAKNNAMIKSRSNELAALGMNYNGSDYLFEDVNVNWTEITTSSDEEWKALVSKITPIIADKKEAIEVKRKQEIEEQKRIAAEEAVRKERERIEQEQRDTEIKRQQEEARKAEELAQATDKEKWADFISQINKLSVPEMRSGQYRKKIAIAKEKLEEIGDL